MNKERNSTHVVCLVPAAGSGLRFGSPEKKQFLQLRNRPILHHTLQNLSTLQWLEEIILIVPAEDLDYCKAHYQATCSKVKAVISGGRTRQESVYCGLHSLAGRLRETDYVLIHDGVRPFFPMSCEGDILRQIRQGNPFTVGHSVTDTIKELGDFGQIRRTLCREKLRGIQTPQGFPFKLILDAHEAARAEQATRLDIPTDDAGLVERLLEGTGKSVAFIEGPADNIKITRPIDLEFANLIIERYPHATTPPSRPRL